MPALAASAAGTCVRFFLCRHEDYNVYAMSLFQGARAFMALQSPSPLAPFGSSPCRASARRRCAQSPASNRSYFKGNMPYVKKNLAGTSCCDGTLHSVAMSIATCTCKTKTS
jgi:hypothetical protein